MKKKLKYATPPQVYGDDNGKRDEKSNDGAAAVVFFLVRAGEVPAS